MEALLHDEYVQGRQVYDGSPGLSLSGPRIGDCRSLFYSSLVENI